MQNRSIETYLNCSFACSCGRTHKSLFAHYIFEPGAIEKLPALLAELGYKKPYLISDTHTHEIAGKQVEETLKKADLEEIALPAYGFCYLKAVQEEKVAAD